MGIGVSTNHPERGVSRLFNIENVIAGNFDDTIFGNAADNVINGGAGADTMRGLEGNDTYIVDDVLDTIIEFPGIGHGIDSVQASVSYTLARNLENLTLTGAADINGTGNMSNNSITGNIGNNILDGGLGVDILTGLAGEDIFLFSTRPTFGASTADHITDFQASDDILQISKTAFGMESDTTATLITVSTASQLSSALQTSNTFVYDTSDGSLYWNSNGDSSGFGTGGIFAVLDNKTALNSSNIVLV
jgi:Ca2+-binding RTX toxin-like protein